MADPTLQKAIERRDAAKREFDKWSAFVDTFLELSPDATAWAGTRNDTASAEQTDPRHRHANAHQPSPDSELARTISIVSQILDERGRPVPRNDLFDEAVRRELVIDGKTPINNFGARLYNSGHFRSISKKDGWWFADRPLAQGAETCEPEAQEEPEFPDAGSIFTKANGEGQPWTE